MGTRASFDKHGTFADPRRGFSFATEPADLRGIRNPAEAMLKIGWTRDQIEANLGETIEICIFDTRAPIPLEGGGQARVSVGQMMWRDLRQRAMADDSFVERMEFHGISRGEIERLFDFAERTPVRGQPRAENSLEARNVVLLRKELERFYGANELYSGMGATIEETGKLGGREIMIRPEETGLQLVEGNHERVEIDKVKQHHIDAIFPRSDE